MTKDNNKMTSFTKIQRIVSKNLDDSTLKRQLSENKYVTALYLSQLAYFKFSTISQKMAEMGAKKISLYDKDGTQAYLAELDNIAIVSFRGTQPKQFEDIKHVLTFWKQQFGDLKVHKGFMVSLMPIVSEMLKDLDNIDREKKKLVFVGHSMGGALATLLALRHKPDELCTFGAPRVAGKDIVGLLHDVEYNRIVTCYDWVSKLPINMPFIGYKHTGTKYILHSEWHWNDIIHPHKLVTYLDALLKDETLVPQD